MSDPRSAPAFFCSEATSWTIGYTWPTTKGDAWNHTPLDPALPAENKSQWMKRVRAHWRARQDIKAALGFKVEEDEGEAS